MMAEETKVVATQVAEVEEPEDDLLVEDSEEEVTASTLVQVAVYLPVEFDREATQIMSIEAELEFHTDSTAHTMRERLFFVAVTLENNIDAFFADRFYEETIFAQDKLEEFLTEKLKSLVEFEGLATVRLTDLSFEGEEEESEEKSPAEEGEKPSGNEAATS